MDGGRGGGLLKGPPITVMLLVFCLSLTYFSMMPLSFSFLNISLYIQASLGATIVNSTLSNGSAFINSSWLGHLHIIYYFLTIQKGIMLILVRSRKWQGLSGMSLRADYWQMSPSEWDVITGWNFNRIQIQKPNFQGAWSKKPGEFINKPAEVFLSFDPGWQEFYFIFSLERFMVLVTSMVLVCWGVFLCMPF